MLTLFVHIYNRATLLEKTLQSIKYHSASVINHNRDNIELLIVDDQSNDNLIDVIKSFIGLLPIRYIKINSNLSELDAKSKNPSLPINIGFLQAKYDKILRFQPETIFMEDAVSTALYAEVQSNVLFGETYSGHIDFKNTSLDNLKNCNFKCTEIDTIGHWQNIAGNSSVCDQKSLCWLQGPAYPYVFLADRKSITDTGLIDTRFIEGYAVEDDYMMLHWGRFGYLPRVVTGMANYHMAHDRDESCSQYYGINQSLMRELQTMSLCELTFRYDFNKSICEQCIIEEKKYEY